MASEIGGHLFPLKALPLIICDPPMDIRDIEESSFFQPDINKSGLHPWQNLYHFPFVDVPHDPPVFGALDIKFGKDPVLQECNPCLLLRYINDQLICHNSLPPISNFRF